MSGKGSGKKPKGAKQKPLPEPDRSGLADASPANVQVTTNNSLYNHNPTWGSRLGA
jgi:hypothetical protein